MWQMGSKYLLKMSFIEIVCEVYLFASNHWNLLFSQKDVCAQKDKIFYFFFSMGGFLSCFKWFHMGKEAASSVVADLGFAYSFCILKMIETTFAFLYSLEQTSHLFLLWKTLPFCLPCRGRLRRPHILYLILRQNSQWLKYQMHRAHIYFYMIYHSNDFTEDLYQIPALPCLLLQFVLQYCKIFSYALGGLMQTYSCQCRLSLIWADLGIKPWRIGSVLVVFCCNRILWQCATDKTCFPL